MLVLGLTGGIATGKSTASQYLSDKYHIPIVDADKIAREIVEPGTPCYHAIVEHFAAKIPNLVVESAAEGKAGGLNRIALGAYVFTHKEELAKLNSITHPAIRKRILYLIFRAYTRNEPVVILDIPLLFESGMDWLCSRVLTIACDEDVQLARLLLRNPELTREQALSRLNSQMSLSKKIQLTDYHIMNNGSVEKLEAELDGFVRSNLPALTVNKSNFYSYELHSWWNQLQLVFPPFALFGATIALIRKFYFKLFI